VLDDGYEDGAVELTGSHRPAGPLRGGKYSRFDGGTHVPFILRWPGQVAPGESSALVSQLDFCASFAALAGVAVPAGGARDSQNILAALLGHSATGRSELVTEGMQRNTLLRQGNWVFLPAAEGLRYSAHTGNEMGNGPWDQLYDLAADVGQQRNVAVDHPDTVTALRRRLRELMDS
jgi:arylsulfatase A-like enzyme